MKRVDETVKRETLYIAISTLVMSALMQSVFLVIGKWNVYVLFGNIFGYAVSVLNFFLMGLTLQNALKKEENDAKKIMTLSQNLRLLMMLAFAALGAALPVFNIWSALIPFFFPRIAVMFRSFTMKKDSEATEKNEK